MVDSARYRSGTFLSNYSEFPNSWFRLQFALLKFDYWLLIIDCWLLFCQFEELDGVVDSGTAEEVDGDGYHWGAVGFAVQVAFHAG